MKFKEIFIKYWDMTLTGFIGGLVVYLMIEYSKTIKNKILLTILTFLIIFILILIYSFIIWFTEKDNLKSLVINLQTFNTKFYFRLSLFLLIIIILYIFTIFLNRNQLLPPLLIVSAVLISSIIFLLLYFFNKIPKDSFNTILLFLFITTMLIIPLTVWTSIPNEPKGINSELLEVEFDFYIINNEISEKELLRYISESNDIWNEYNISIIKNNVRHKEINLTTEDTHFLFEKGYTKEECLNYTKLMEQIIDNSSKNNIILLDNKKSVNIGQGCLCGCNFLLFSQEKILYKDLTGWDLAHEIGHVFGLIHPENFYKLNLMNDKYKFFYKSSFLTQKQVNDVVNTIKK